MQLDRRVLRRVFPCVFPCVFWRHRPEAVFVSYPSKIAIFLWNEQFNGEIAFSSMFWYIDRYVAHALLFDRQKNVELSWRLIKCSEEVLAVAHSCIQADFHVWYDTRKYVWASKNNMLYKSENSTLLARRSSREERKSEVVVRRTRTAKQQQTATLHK